jgi:hypothetical protein
MPAGSDYPRRAPTTPNLLNRRSTGVAGRAVGGGRDALLQYPRRPRNAHAPRSSSALADGLCAHKELDKALELATTRKK